MTHKELKKIVKDSNKAILFIHGIAGTPNHFTDFVKLIPKDISVYNILLDGHGKGVKDFSKTSMRKWEEQVRKTIEELTSTHEEIYIVAHSMGTLLAIEQAVECEKIKKLFLLAVPIKLSLKPRMFINTFKVYFNKINPEDKIAIDAKRCYGIEGDRNVFKYLGWIPRYIELFSKIRSTKRLLPLLNVCCSAYQSHDDEMVSNRSIEYLKKSSNIKVLELKKSGHYYYEKTDKEELLKEFKRFII